MVAARSELSSGPWTAAFMLCPRTEGRGREREQEKKRGSDCFFLLRKLLSYRIRAQH